MAGETTSWTIIVPTETDLAVRSVLEKQGGETALSLFVVEAVRSRLHDAGASTTESDLVDDFQMDVDAAVERGLEDRQATGQDAGLEQEVALGLRDIDEGRVRDFDLARIAERGRMLSGSRIRFG